MECARGAEVDCSARGEGEPVWVERLLHDIGDFSVYRRYRLATRNSVTIVSAYG